MIYMDNAATTAIKPEVLEAMEPYLKEKYSNPSASYSMAFDVRKAIETAREQIASSINAEPWEIFFTSGGTESDNWAIRGICETASFLGRYHVISQPTEHKAVINPLVYMEDLCKAELTMIPVNSDGLISLHSLQRSIRQDTCLVSVMTVNNEIGTVQQIGKIGEICRMYDIPFHTDAVQAYGHIPIHVKAQNISLLSASGHKLGAPKGIGFLYIRNDCRMKMAPLLLGGSQEALRRAGTENVAGIIGLAEAAWIATRDMCKNREKIKKLSDYFYTKLKSEFPLLIYNGEPSAYRMPSHINVSFFRYGIDGASLLALLDEYGIYASSGSACNSASDKPSYVLTAIGRTEAEAQSSIRFTINQDNTMNEIDEVIRVLKLGVDILTS